MTGQIAHPDVNADNALALGQQAMKDISGWPETLYDTGSKLIVKMDVKKHVPIGKEHIYDQELRHVSLVYLH